MTLIKTLIETKNLEMLREALSADPALANRGLPYDNVNTTVAHPLHRLCDAVFNGLITDAEAVGIASLLLEYGADINGGLMTEKHDTPLIAAASLSAEKVGLYYIDQGAYIHHPGCHGGTALHWAVWCGQDRLAERLLKEGADVDQRCLEFSSTPLFWAVHAIKSGHTDRIENRLMCVRLLAEAGCDTSIPNASGKTVYAMLTDDDETLKALLY